MNIVFKCLKTPVKKYVYDRNTNVVVTVSDVDYDELIDVEEGRLKPEESKAVKKLQDHGLLLENRVVEIAHPDTQYAEHHIENRLSQLILQVTQQCNLRCEYCVYSGGYTNRHHANRIMTVELAKKGIDYFIAHSFESNNLYLSFYGGEPLLQFELIKEVVKYINSIVEGKKVYFSMTTNATLLKGKIADYLVENDFDITISLDGSQEEHDKNRKFINGQGSFTTIMKNIKDLRERYPKYVKERIKFNTVISPKVNMACVKEFFDTDEVMSDTRILFNTVSENNSLTDIEFEDNFYIVRKYEYIKLLLMMIGKINEKYVSKLVLRSKDNIDLLIKSLSKHKEISAIMHHNGPCIAGARRLFINVDGDFYPCEKVSECKGDVCIGNIENGINIEKVKNLINIGNLTKDECLVCWNLFNCSMCAADCEVDGNLDANHKVQHCKKVKTAGLLAILEICALEEFGYALKEHSC